MDMEFEPLDGNITCVRLKGRMDTAGVDRIEMKFTAGLVSGGRSGIVDVSEVTFLASMGVRMFIASARAMHNKGAKIALFGAPELVQDVFETVALDQIVPIATSQAQALALVNA